MEVTRSGSPNERRKRCGGPRRKTGCFTCKARHTRCDEKKPVCSNCERLGLQCRTTEFITHSAWGTVAATRPKAEEPIISPKKARQPSAGSILNHATSILSLVSASTVSGPSPTVTAAASGSTAPTSQSLSTSPKTPESTPVLVDVNDEIAYLFTVYRARLATWMDIFDFQQTYQIEVSRRASYSDLLLRCICAFAAKHLSMLASGDVWLPIASRYYGEALNCLIGEVSGGEPHSEALTAAILLMSYELLEAAGEPHRSHSMGALDLIRSRGVCATSVGLDRANFFIYIRHEITIALANERPLQLDPGNWNVAMPKFGAPEDQLANHLMWLAGTTINLIYGGDLTADRQLLIDRLDVWHGLTSASFRGTTYEVMSDEGLRKVFFAVPAAAGATLWYHLLNILLLAEPRDYGSTNHPLVQDHANMILSICNSELPDGVRCFSIMPIYFAGKHTEDITKKFCAWTLLANIEQALGYRTQAEVRSLKQMIRQNPT
ncbi:hypothetical protein DL764_000462 [Monosporascus ibericus]|uniref:Zn(2)-C6 fungal-type domain-containing protein n=1 Tax=Monosporascus ibericus TaxID=155417 RepID=A0A4Q4TTE6_9PEZI|nr:hypothetical protein DL764_000462 [Monosporascus ibericus]